MTDGGMGTVDFGSVTGAFQDLISDLDRCVLQSACVDCPRMQLGCNGQVMLARSAQALKDAMQEIEKRDDIIFVLKMERLNLEKYSNRLRDELTVARTKPMRTDRW